MRLRPRHAEGRTHRRICLLTQIRNSPIRAQERELCRGIQVEGSNVSIDCPGQTELYLATTSKSGLLDCPYNLVATPLEAPFVLYSCCKGLRN